MLLVWSRSGSTQIGYRDLQLLADTFSLTEHVQTLHALNDVLKTLVAEVAEFS